MTIYIEITRGKTATVDGCDADLLQHKWQCNVIGKTDTNRVCYASRWIGGRKDKQYVAMHRLIAERMGHDLTGMVVDHIDGDGLNNRRSNLRVVSRAENAKNLTGVRSNNTSGYMGVNYEPRYRNKWVATIYVNYKKHIVGRFPTAEEAHQARLVAERQLWGVQPRREAVHA